LDKNRHKACHVLILGARHVLARSANAPIEGELFKFGRCSSTPAITKDSDG
jgi:hypothetical protein